MKTFDYVVVGGGLTGLLIARKLANSGADTALLESENATGGVNRPATLAGEQIENGLRFLPKSELLLRALSNLEQELGIDLIKSIRPVDCKTYEASGFRDFVGFGEKAPAFYDQFKYFLANEEIELTMPLYALIEKLQTDLKCTVLNRHIVTRYNVQADIDPKKIASVTVNGSKTIHGKNFIHCGQVRDLHVLLEDEQLNIRAKGKLKKSSYWMAMQLDLVSTNEITTDLGMLVLNGTTDDDIGPCVGRFKAFDAETGLQHSNWISFIDLESSEEAENYGEILKKMKRQIKRAFPNSLDHIKGERISVSPALSSGELKLNANGTLPNAQNLWVASPSVSAFANLAGAFLQSQFILSSLGFASWDANVMNPTPNTEAAIEGEEQIVNDEA